MAPDTDSAPPTDRRTILKLLVAGACGTTGGAAFGVDTRHMQRTIPRSGESIPMVGLGTWQTFDAGANPTARAPLREVLRLFAEHGGRVLDSSPMYDSAERVAGDLAADLGIGSKLFVATKVWTSGRDAGIRQMEESMRLLRAPRVDLMQVHNLVDLRTHERTLAEWKRSGRIRYLGITHYHAGAHAELEQLVRTRRYDFVQFNYSMEEPEAEQRLLPACAESGTAVLVNRPFAEGGLFGRVKGRALPEWSAEFDCTSWAQFFLKYILAHPAVTCAIPATRNPKHIADNLGAAVGRLPDENTRARMRAFLGLA